MKILVAVFYVMTPCSDVVGYHRVQTGSGAHPTSYLTGTGGPFPGV